MRWAMFAMALPAAVFVLIGVAASVSKGSLYVSEWILGEHWTAYLRNELINLGMATDRAFFLMEVLEDLTALVPFGITSLILGLLRSRLAHVVALVLIAAWPISAIVPLAFGGWPHGRLGTLIGTALCVFCWSICWGIRGCHYGAGYRLGNKFIITCTLPALVTILVFLGAIGWIIIKT